MAIYSWKSVSFGEPSGLTIDTTIKVNQEQKLTKNNRRDYRGCTKRTKCILERGKWKARRIENNTHKTWRSCHWPEMNREHK